MLRLIRNDLYRVINSFWNIFVFLIYLSCLMYFVVIGPFGNVLELTEQSPKSSYIEATTFLVTFITIANVIFSPIFNVVALSRDVSCELLNNLTMTGVKRSAVYYSRLISSIVIYLVLLVFSLTLALVLSKVLGVKCVFDYSKIIKVILTYSSVEIAITSVYLFLLFWSRNLFWPCGLPIAGFGGLVFFNEVYKNNLDNKYFEIGDYSKLQPSVTFFDDNYLKWIIVACLIAIVSSIIGEKLFNYKDL